MSLSPNAQTILLLTAPLIAGRRESSSELLTSGEYNRLARALRDRQRQPSDLLGPDAGDVIRSCLPMFDGDRLQRLLGRGFLLSQAIDRWQARGIWVVSRADAQYPGRLKARLKEETPPVLYGCGEAAILETGGLAVVGSRHVDDAPGGVHREHRPARGGVALHGGVGRSTRHRSSRDAGRAAGRRDRGGDAGR